MNRDEIKEVCEEIRSLHRQRDWYLEMRKRNMNRLVATVAGAMGYRSGLIEDERKNLFGKAIKVIKEVIKGGSTADVPTRHKIIVVHKSIAVYDDEEKRFKKLMVEQFQSLPISDWVEAKGQRGFGVFSAAKIIGETGDLFDYSNPAKLWRRLGLAPFTKDGVIKMGATWRKSGKDKVSLNASDWTEYGYSPRRRSMMWNVTDSLMKLNQDGPYKTRYDEVKERVLEARHPRTLCHKCKGSGVSESGGKCANCKGGGQKRGWADNHAKLLASKLLVKEFWVEWTKEGFEGRSVDRNLVAVGDGW